MAATLSVAVGLSTDAALGAGSNTHLLPDRDHPVILLRFLHIRGLFFKQVMSFFFAFIVVGLTAGFLDAWTAGYRFRSDARQLLDRADFPAMAATGAALAPSDSGCRRTAMYVGRENRLQ